MCCAETSVRNYHSLRNNPGDGSYCLLRGGSLKSHKCAVISMMNENYTNIFTIPR